MGEELDCRRHREVTGMVFVINNLRYDTDKMELVAKVEKFYSYNSILLNRIYGTDIGNTFNCDLYRSSKGN